MAGDRDDVEKSLARLKLSRRGKKAAITKRVQRIEKYIVESGSRKLISKLFSDLTKVFSELEGVCKEISDLSDNVDENNCLENYRIEVEECKAIVEDCLESRKDEPPSSSGSVTSSWLRRHAEYLATPSDASSEGGTDGKAGEGMSGHEEVLEQVTERFTSLSLENSPEVKGNKVNHDKLEVEGNVQLNPFERSTSPNLGMFIGESHSVSVEEVRAGETVDNRNDPPRHPPGERSAATLPDRHSALPAYEISNTTRDRMNDNFSRYRNNSGESSGDWKCDGVPGIPTECKEIWLRRPLDPTTGYRDLNTQHHDLAMEIKKNRLEYARKSKMFRNEQEIYNEGEKVRINKRDKEGGLPQICYDSDDQDMEHHENLSSTPGPYDHDNANTFHYYHNLLDSLGASSTPYTGYQPGRQAGYFPESLEWQTPAVESEPIIQPIVLEDYRAPGRTPDMSVETSLDTKDKTLVGGPETEVRTNIEEMKVRAEASHEEEEKGMSGKRKKETEANHNKEKAEAGEILAIRQKAEAEASLARVQKAEAEASLTIKQKAEAEASLAGRFKTEAEASLATKQKAGAEASLAIKQKAEAEASLATKQKAGAEASLAIKQKAEAEASLAVRKEARAEAHFNETRIKIGAESDARLEAKRRAAAELNQMRVEADMAEKRAEAILAEMRNVEARIAEERAVEATQGRNRMMEDDYNKIKENRDRAMSGATEREAEAMRAETEAAERRIAEAESRIAMARGTIESMQRERASARGAENGQDSRVSFHQETGRTQDEAICMSGSSNRDHVTDSRAATAFAINTEAQSTGVDAWIDVLDDQDRMGLVPGLASDSISAEIMMSWLVKQHLPKVTVPTFGGSALDWVNFITKFHEVVHRQQYLNDTQRCQLLFQHLQGEALRAVKSYPNNTEGYVKSLKRLKRLFGQRPKVARALLANVVKGKSISDDDIKGLWDFYYAMSDCLVALKRLNYHSDLYSSDTLAQAVERLPHKLKLRWAEKSLLIRRTEEPNLLHMEEWLQDRLLALQEAYFPDHKSKQKHKNEIRDEREEHTHMLAGDVGENCRLCGDKHLLWKCKKFKDMTPVKRYELAREAKLCYNCLQTGHMIKSCNSPYRCFETGCSAKHHTSLHTYFKEKSEGKTDTESTPTSHTNVTTARAAGHVVLQIVAVRLYCPRDENIYVDTHALLDPCSQSTLIREDVAQKIKLEGKQIPVNVVSAMERTRITVKQVEVDIASRCGTFRAKADSSTYVIPKDKFNMPSRPALQSSADPDIFTHLQDIDTEAVSSEDVTILIGANVPAAVLTYGVRVGSRDQVLAVQTKFGWTLFGPSLGLPATKEYRTSTLQVTEVLDEMVEAFWEEEDIPTINVNCIQIQSDRMLHERVEAFWRQEHQGIIPAKQTSSSTEDKNAINTMEKQTIWTGEKYEIPMLWKSADITLPNNYLQARRRFAYAEKRYRVNRELHDKMNKVITGYLNADPPYARKMTAQEAARESKRSWILPIHPVVNEKKPGKVRVVNNAAAIFEGTSLNDHLVTGPDLLNSLVGILMRFRYGKIAIAADVEAMYHQVRVPKDDADSLRFLWKEDIDVEGPPDMYQMLVHVFGAKDSSGCANYALQRTARDHHQDYDSLTYESVLKSFYVDDLLKSLSCVASAIKLALELMSMLRQGGFRLTKFTSNCREVLDALPPSEVAPNAQINIDSEQIERALGVLWDTKADVFVFSSSLPDAPATKRGILKVTSSIFDPAGYLGPFTIRARIILQDIWRLGLDWDQEVGEDVKARWKVWLEGAKKVDTVRLQRQYSVEEKSIKEVQLHIFCDASEAAFGCVAYVRFTYKDGAHECSLVMSKSRLAPIKVVTLPRLELNAARAGARLSQLVVHEIGLPVERVKFWSDSTITLKYINNTKKRLKVFEANRATEINELSEPSQWGHIAGKENPADMITRGITDPEVLNSGDWFKGPQFLREDEDKWPSAIVSELQPEDEGVRKNTIMVALAMLDEVSGIDFSRFSNWPRLRRVVAWVVRFVENCKQKEEDKDLSPTLTVEEVQIAEKIIVKDVQASEFEEDIKKIRAGKITSNRLAALNPFVDNEGTLRVGGRLQDIRVPMFNKHPPILPRNHDVTTLIVDWLHRRNGHVGPDHVLALLRQEYWVLGARTAINMMIARCFFCKVKRAKQLFPFMANLPQCRAAVGEPPFSKCGVDLFGPIFIKQGRKRLKRWGVLFTCMTVRCIHLEVVESAETDTFINALRRFVNRRGCPEEMFSDNGTNFRGMTAELKEVFGRGRQSRQ